MDLTYPRLILKFLLVSVVPVANSNDDFKSWLVSYKKFAFKSNLAKSDQFFQKEELLLPTNLQTDLKKIKKIT